MMMNQATIANLCTNWNLDEAEFVHPSIMSNLSGVKNIFDVVIANRLSDDIW